MSADKDDDNVEIVQLQEGTVRIVLPPTVSDHTHDTSRDVDETSFTRPWSPNSSTQITTTTVMSTTQIKRQSFPGKENENKRVSIPTTQKLDRRFSGMEHEKERVSSPTTRTPLEIVSDKHDGYQFTAERDRPTEQSKTAAKDRLSHIQDQTFCLRPLEPGGKGNGFSTHEDRNEKENISSGTGEKSAEEKKMGERTKKPLHSDESSVPTKGVQRLAMGKRTSDGELKTSRRHDQRKVHMFTDITHPKKPRVLNSEANSISDSVNRQKTRESFYCSNRDRSLYGPEVTATEQCGNTDGKERILNNQTPIITTLSTGITRILVKRPLLRQERKLEDLHALENENRPNVIPDDAEHSIDSNEILNSAEDRDILFSNFSFDCLEDVQVSPESEEQLAHLILTVDTSENESDPLQHSDSHTDVEQSGNRERICSEITSDAFIVDVDSSREIHLGDDYPERSQSTSVFVGSVSKEHHLPFTESMSESDGSVPISKGGKSSDRSMKGMEVQSSLTESECTRMSAGVPMEDNSDSECLFSGHTGHTYSRAMWRSMSAEADHIQPSFVSRAPLHEAFSKLERELSGSTSSDEECFQRRSKSFSFFSQFPGADKTPIKWTGNKHIPNESKHKIFHSANNDSREKRMEVLQESDHKNAERYLHAALALADTKRRRPKSASDYSPEKMRLRELKTETSDRHKHLQKKKTSTTGDRQSSSALLMSKTHPATDTQGTSSGIRETEKNRFHYADKDSPFDAGSTNRKDTKANSTDASNASSSADSLTSDSQRSACLTPESESESASSSADSVHTAYFVPRKPVSVNSSGVTQGTKRSQAGHQTSQCTSPDSLSDFHSLSGPLEVSDIEVKGKKKRRHGVVAFSSSDRSSELPSVNGSPDDSDTGQKTPLSRSSSNGFLTSESEIGPLVTFPRSRKTTWGAGPVLPTAGAKGAEAGGERDQESVTAVELRCRYSSEEYVPASPYAGYLRRKSSNLSDGATPLFLQRQRLPSRSGHVRQLSLDIGEEFENVHSPRLPQRRGLTSTTSFPAEDDDNVFFGPSTSFNRRTSSLREECIPLEEFPLREAGAPKSPPPVRKKSHQTSAKLRLLYPNPADPRCLAMSEETQREILSTLTRAEVSRLRMAGSPLLELLQDRNLKDAAHRVKKTRLKQTDDSAAAMSAQTDPAAVRGRAQAALPLIHTDPRSQKPAVTVQPMPREVVPRQEFAPSPPRPDGGSRSGAGDVVISIPPPDVPFDSLATLPPFKRRLLPNPFNQVNQRCHSTLQFPCCFFFCFLCCAPAVVFMKRSDYEFDYGSLEKSRYYGRRTTVLYVTGAAVAVCLLVASVVATVIFLQESLLERRGWS